MTTSDVGLTDDAFEELLGLTTHEEYVEFFKRDDIWENEGAD